MDGTQHRDLDTPHISRMQDISKNLHQYVKQDIHFLANKNTFCFTYWICGAA